MIEPHELKFLVYFAIALCVVVALPAAYGLFLSNPGAHYLGYQFNTDDQMVYAAWVRQSQMGQVLFDNRFAVDPQPRLTFHLYFLILGWIARVGGIRLTTHLARIALTACFPFLYYRIAAQLTPNVFIRKFSLLLVALGGGLGFLAWADFGRTIVAGGPIAGVIGRITGGLLPTDVWQPEGFVFPSLLTNGLFAASLALILCIFLCVLRSKQKGVGPVIGGFIAMAALMNIHSYDALLVTLVLAGLLAASIGAKNCSLSWVVRCLIIGIGAVGPALWFKYVISQDPVFAERAATLTYSPAFKAVVCGYFPIFILGLIGSVSARDLTSESFFQRHRKPIGAVLYALVLAVLWATSNGGDSYAINLSVWIPLFLITLVSLALLADPTNDAKNLILAWALVGVVALYFPALYQRKLAMGLVIPWATLAAVGFWRAVQSFSRTSRNFGTIFVVLVLSGTSIQWIFREIRLIQANVSTTAVQPTFLNVDEEKILEALEPAGTQRTIVMAVPGVPTPLTSSDGTSGVAFAAPTVPDMNPILSGLDGVYTFAGHWSETPNYAARRSESLQSLFLATATRESATQFAITHNVDYIVEVSPDSPLAPNFQDVSFLGSVVYRGAQLELIKVTKSSS